MESNKKKQCKFSHGWWASPFTPGDREYPSGYHARGHRCTCIYLLAEEWVNLTILPFSPVSSITSIQVQAARPRTPVCRHAYRGSIHPDGVQWNGRVNGPGVHIPLEQWTGGPNVRGVQLYSDTVDDCPRILNAFVQGIAQRNGNDRYMNISLALRVRNSPKMVQKMVMVVSLL